MAKKTAQLQTGSDHAMARDAWRKGVSAQCLMCRAFATMSTLLSHAPLSLSLMHTYVPAQLLVR